MRLRRILAAVTVALFPFVSVASDIISTGTPERLFNLGVRVGVNSSNRTFNKDYFQQWNVNSWGTGFDAGVVLNLNMREFFTIQPGFFFESRTGYYSYSQDLIDLDGKNDTFTQLGHLKTYSFIVPVMFSFRLNVAGNLKWILEAGPYAQFKLHSSDSDDIQVISRNPSLNVSDVQVAKSNFTDFGAKLGTGIMLNNRYSFSIHYLAGFCDVWKRPFEGGKNKAWTFTLGYDF